MLAHVDAVIRLDNLIACHHIIIINIIINLMVMRADMYGMGVSCLFVHGLFGI